MREHEPCVSAGTDGRHCLAAVLFGATCCPRGDCAVCEELQDRMRAAGFPEIEVARAWLRARVPQVSTCPVCGLPPPPQLERLAPLPRLPRLGRTHSGSWECRVCGRALPQRRRHYCSHACWREFVRAAEMDGMEIVSPEPPRAYRVRVG